MSVGSLEGNDGFPDDLDAAHRQLGVLISRGLGGVVQEQHDVVGPLPEDQCLVDRPRAGTEHRERLVGDLETVAVGADDDVGAPQRP